MSRFAAVCSLVVVSAACASAPRLDAGMTVSDAGVADAAVESSDAGAAQPSELSIGAGVIGTAGSFGCRATAPLPVSACTGAAAPPALLEGVTRLLRSVAASNSSSSSESASVVAAKRIEVFVAEPSSDGGVVVFARYDADTTGSYRDTRGNSGSQLVTGATPTCARLVVREGKPLLQVLEPDCLPGLGRVPTKWLQR